MAGELVSSGGPALRPVWAEGAAGTGSKGACQVDVRIGIVQSMKELDIELPDDADRDTVLAEIEAALSGEGSVLWMVDRKGRHVGVPASKVAYIELDAPSAERRVGFGVS